MGKIERIQINYLKATNFVYPVCSCSHYTNIVSNRMQSSSPYIFSICSFSILELLEMQRSSICNKDKCA